MIRVANSIDEKDFKAYINHRYIRYCIVGIVFGLVVVGLICLRFLVAWEFFWQRGLLDAFALTCLVIALMMPAIYFVTKSNLVVSSRYAYKKLSYDFESDYFRIDAYGDLSEAHCKKSYSEIESFGKLNSGIHFIGLYFMILGNLYIVKPQSIEQENEIYALLSRSKSQGAGGGK